MSAKYELADSKTADMNQVLKQYPSKDSTLKGKALLLNMHVSKLQIPRKPLNCSCELYSHWMKINSYSMSVLTNFVFMIIKHKKLEAQTSCKETVANITYRFEIRISIHYWVIKFAQCQPDFTKNCRLVRIWTDRVYRCDQLHNLENIWTLEWS